jgi:uncharacterized repeat protein (TIGR01451 family)
VPLTGASITSDTLAQGVTGLSLTSGPTGPSGDAGTANVVDPAEAWTYAATYVVTQANIDAGTNITNTVVFDTAQTSPQSAFVNTPMPVANPALSIDKSWAFVPVTGDVNGNGIVDAGDTIRYTFAVRNSGNLTIRNVTVTDTFAYGPVLPVGNDTLTDNAPAGDSNDSSGPGVWSMLAPADIVTFTANYTVTQADVDLRAQTFTSDLQGRAGPFLSGAAAGSAPACRPFPTAPRRDRERGRVAQDRELQN